MELIYANHVVVFASPTDLQLDFGVETRESPKYFTHRLVLSHTLADWLQGALQQSLTQLRAQGFAWPPLDPPLGKEPTDV